MSEDVTKKEEMASTPQEESEVAENQTDSNVGVDYKAEAERLQKQLEETDATLQRTQRAIVRLKQNTQDTKQPEIEVNNVDIETMVANAVNKSVNSALVEQEISRTTNNDDEAKLIRLHLDNTIQSTGNVVEDVANARALANRERNKQVFEELKRTQATTEAERATSAGAKSETKEETEWSPADKKLLKNFGAL